MLKPFPQEKLKLLLQALEERRPHGRAIAAFDADGTLWDTDLGENLFQYQIDKAQVPLPDDPWEHYRQLKKTDRHTAYLWLAQINSGVPLTELRAWAEDAVAQKPLPIFEEKRAIFKKLKELDVEIYIVTASVKWAVEPGARRLGLHEDQVIGIETEVHKGLITDVQKGFITWREGKPKALLERTGGIKPYFSAGNTEGDLWLLEAATEIRLVVSAAPENNRLWRTESKMLSIAKERGWFHHRYF